MKVDDDCCNSLDLFTRFIPSPYTSRDRCPLLPFTSSPSCLPPPATLPPPSPPIAPPHLSPPVAPPSFVKIVDFPIPALPLNTDTSRAAVRQQDIR
ncbi:unnamed protein product [Lactuca virosa]|uniref:Uncharacterized protein n=1 Tax=Lactuca virosa TaxID=75947 RepID=A0AAU9LW61_9ASTR|nr:unnamed protein product [Lactuca virosa]